MASRLAAAVAHVSIEVPESITLDSLEPGCLHNIASWLPLSAQLCLRLTCTSLRNAIDQGYLLTKTDPVQEGRHEVGIRSLRLQLPLDTSLTSNEGHAALLSTVSCLKLLPPVQPAGRPPGAAGRAHGSSGTNHGEEDGATYACMTLLPMIKRLQRLDLTDVPVTDTVLAAVRHLAPGLSRLDLPALRIVHHPRGPLHALRGLPKLCSLHMTLATSQGGQLLNPLSGLQHLTQLKLSLVRPCGFEASMLSVLRNLRVLDLQICYESSETHLEAADPPAHHAGGGGAGGTGLSSLASLAPTLSELYLHMLGDMSMQERSALQALTGLEVLDVACGVMPLKPIGLHSFLGPDMGALRVLRINNWLTTQALELLCTCPQLQVLDAWALDLQPSARRCGLQSLRELHLQQVFDGSGAALSLRHVAPRLEHLSLKITQDHMVDDVEAEYETLLSHVPSTLTSLHIDFIALHAQYPPLKTILGRACRVRRLCVLGHWEAAYELQPDWLSGFNHLDYLELDGVMLSMASFTPLGAALPSLLHIKLWNLEIGPLGLVALLSMTHLRVIELAGCTCMDAVRDLATLSLLPHVREIVVRQCEGMDWQNSQDMRAAVQAIKPYLSITITDELESESAE